MKQQLRKPENWQDFEELCRMLWAEIWNCPETKKNGRNGQDQHGVDVSGTPSWEVAEYYGIQCKGKDDYTHAQLTEKEIDREIEKAKNFKPQLKKFYFATTANKDATIEEYVRLKDVECRKAGLFEVHLFSWEEIVTLIDQNKRTHDWYVRKINFKTLYDVKVTFQDGLTEIDFKPILIRNSVKYKLKPHETNIDFRYYRSPEEIRETHLELMNEPQPVRYFINGVSHNKSSCVFYLTLTNKGDSVLENYKLYFEFGDSKIFAERVRKQSRFLDDYKYTYNTIVYHDFLGGVFEPKDTILVQKDSVSSDDICIRPTVDHDQTILLNWHLVAKDFDTKGVLTINIKPRIKDRATIESYEYPLEDEVRLENYKGDDDED